MSDNTKTAPRRCINCKLGSTAETAHEWIETECPYRKWHSPFTDACEHYIPEYEEDTDDA